MLKKYIRLFVVMLTLGIAMQGNAKELYVYNWTEYLPQEIINKFTKETGIKVIYSTFTSNEEMYSKLKLNPKGYDVIFPSSYYIGKMIREDMLLPLDKSQIPNFKNLTAELLNKPYDPNNKYSIPYAYGLTGIAFNANVIDGSTISSWQALWDEKYRDSILINDDVRDVFSIALLIKGYSINTTNPDEIKEAYNLLQELVPNIREYNSNLPEVPFIQEEINLGMLWNGSYVRGVKQNKNLKYVYPKEGGIMWIDTIAIPKSSTNQEEAFKFINFILEPENAKAIMEKISYAMPNDAMKKILPSDIANNPYIFIPKAELDNSSLEDDIGSSIDIYNQYWQKLRVNTAD